MRNIKHQPQTLSLRLMHHSSRFIVLAHTTDIIGKGLTAEELVTIANVHDPHRVSSVEGSRREVVAGGA